MDVSITALAARQHGVVARRQLVSDGISPGVVHGLVRRGQLEPVHHGVYTVPGSAPTPMREAMSAALRAGPDARVVGERMLAAAGVRDADAAGSYTVLVQPGRRLVGVEFPWREDAGEGLVTPAVVDGVPSLDVAGNLIEAAVDAGTADAVRRLADGVRWSGRRRMASVARLAAQLPHHRGTLRLVLLGCLDVDAAESEPERVLETVLAPFDPERQVGVLPGVRLDFLLRRLGVAVEYDGPDHESGHAKERDAARDALVWSECRIRTVRITRSELRDPPSVLAMIVAAAGA